MNVVVVVDVVAAIAMVGVSVMWRLICDVVRLSIVVVVDVVVAVIAVIVVVVVVAVVVWRLFFGVCTAQYTKSGLSIFQLSLFERFDLLIRCTCCCC